MTSFLRTMAVALVMAWGAATQAAERVALVVGNAAYASATPLANPLNDARDVAAALERLGFEVILATDATQAELLAAIDRFAAALAGADVALFYYSGHGLQIDGTNFLLPVDISISSERSVRYGAIDVGELVGEMERSAAVSLVVLDACRDNPFLAQLQRTQPASRSTAASRGLAPIRSGGSGTIIAFAAESGAVASDGAGGHSPYTAALLAEMEAPGVEVGLMFRRVARRVVEATDGAQYPELLVRLTTEFYMASPPEVEVAAAAPLVPPSVAIAGATPVVVPVLEPVAPAQPADVAGLDRTSVQAPRPYSAMLALMETGETPADPSRQWEPAPWRRQSAPEPNDSPMAAAPLELDAELDLAIDGAGDGDWVYFSVGGRGSLRVLAEAVPPEIDLSARVLDANGRDIAGWIGAPRPGGVLDAVFDLPAPGAYWVEIRDGFNDAWSATPATVRLSFATAEDGFEPNDAPSQARLLPIDGEARFAMLPRGDADWFRFAVREPGRLSIAATGVSPALDIAMRLVDEDLRDLGAWATAPRPGGDTMAEFDLARPGFYRLEVRDGGNDARAVEGVTLTTRFTASGDVYEPDDTPGAAAPIADTGEHGLAIFPRGDADWLRLDVEQSGELTLSATEVPPGIDVAFRVLNADMVDLTGWMVAPRPGGDTVGTVDLGRPGAYLVEVRDGGNDAGWPAPFLFRTTLRPSPDVHEPNDSFGFARPLQPGGALAFAILPLGDADWFRVRVPEPGELSIRIDEGPANLDLTFRVLDADQRDLTGWVPAYAKGGLTEGSADLPLPGDYFIEVRDGNNDGRSVEHATLSTRYAPIVGGHEPDDSFGSAFPVQANGASVAHILPRGDADWQTFYVTGPGRLEVAVDEVPENLDVAVRVLDGDQRDLTGWIVAPGPGGRTAGGIDLPRGGWYWLEIRDGGNDARSPVPFRVSRNFTPL